MANISFRTTLSAGASESACEFLSVKTGLSKARVKDAMNKGAVWLKRKNGKAKRLRRASAPLAEGDRVEMYYDGELLSLRPPEAHCLSDQKHYTVWFKPAGLLAQGTRYGDHCSLMRQAELHFRSSREIFLVHRLDREASGLMVLAHSKDAAAKLSALFQKNLAIKKYRVEVLGNLGEKGPRGTIELPLYGKASFTEYAVIAYNAAANTSVVDVIIKTGRLHQIRRHFEMIGFPVMGDPKYGTGNKNTDGMKLSAVSLRFTCPFLKREVQYALS
ncbi:MAG: RluA family pseudouridine synthase [Nitrospirota bacterium]|nr:RluA family pseudouridine synthase [Nitrospirota bacterium]